MLFKKGLCVLLVLKTKMLTGLLFGLMQGYNAEFPREGRTPRMNEGKT